MLPRADRARPDHLVLLPAVDVAGGQAVQLVQGVAGYREGVRRPRCGRRAAVGRRRRRVDPPGRPGRRLRPRRQRRRDRRRDRGPDRRSSRPQGRAVRRDPRRRQPRPGPWPPVARGSTSAPRRWNRPDWCDEIIAAHGEQIAIGLDVRGTRLAARGWTEEGGELYETLDRLNAAGCARYVVTDVASDGMLSGPNLDLLRARLRSYGRRGGRQRRHQQPRRHRRADRPRGAAASRAPSSAPPCTSATSPCPRRSQVARGARRRLGARTAAQGPRVSVPGRHRSERGRPWPSAATSSVGNAARPDRRWPGPGCGTCWPARRSSMTGVTGFIGEQLLWKMLTELPDTKPAVLVRRKGSAGPASGDPDAAQEEDLRRPRRRSRRARRPAGRPDRASSRATCPNVPALPVGPRRRRPLRRRRLLRPADRPGVHDQRRRHQAADGAGMLEAVTGADGDADEGPALRAHLHRVHGRPAPRRDPRGGRTCTTSTTRPRREAGLGMRDLVEAASRTLGAADRAAQGGRARAPRGRLPHHRGRHRAAPPGVGHRRAGRGRHRAGPVARLDRRLHVHQGPRRAGGHRPRRRHRVSVVRPPSSSPVGCTRTRAGSRASRWPSR